MPLLAPDAWLRSGTSDKYFTFTSSLLCCSLQFASLSKMSVWMQKSFALPLHSPLFSPQSVEERTKFLEWLNISLFLGHLSFPDLWLKWDKPADPQVAGLHWSMVVLCLNCSESTSGHLRCLNSYVCIISYGLSLYHKFCPMMLFWILFSKSRHFISININII